MLHQRPNTFAQTCLLALSFSLQSDGGPYIFAQVVCRTEMRAMEFLDPAAFIDTYLLKADPVPRNRLSRL